MSPSNRAPYIRALFANISVHPNSIRVFLRSISVRCRRIISPMDKSAWLFMAAPPCFRRCARHRRSVSPPSLHLATARFVALGAASPSHHPSSTDLAWGTARSRHQSRGWVSPGTLPIIDGGRVKRLIYASKVNHDKANGEPTGVTKWVVHINAAGNLSYLFNCSGSRHHRPRCSSHRRRYYQGLGHCQYRA
jgi:hypothetical protein